MKVVLASTPEQENHIEELVDYMYSTIFPDYFTDAEIIKFKELKIMSLQSAEKYYNGTLKEAFQLISSLQAIIVVLESVQNHPIDDANRDIFDRNVEILKEYGLVFPFHLDHFVPKKTYALSQFQKPVNELLV